VVRGRGGDGSRLTVTIHTPRPGSSPTLDEVARLAGVSRATASRAVNGGQRVSPKAQSAVDEAVRQLGYTPNPAARSLVTRRTDSVALVIPEPDERVFSDPFFARTLHSVTSVLAERDLQTVLLLARPGHEEDRLLRYLGSRHVDGAIVVSSHRADSLADHMAGLSLPCTFIGRPWTSAERVAYVDTDNLAGGREAAQVLVERGCARIGCIAGPPDMTASADRLEGWRSVMAAAGMPSDAVVHGDFTVEGGASAAEQLLARHPDVDGIAVASDLMALGAMQTLTAQGRKVPDDVAITGYDDLGIADRTDPPLTTLRNPISAMGEQATRLLLEQFDNGATPVRVIFPPTLVRRTSA